jgi:hypothetical protein
MERNVGGTDRLVRLVAGALVGLLGIAALAGMLQVGPVAGALALLVGVVLVGTALTQTCLAYKILGVDTCSRRA